MNREGYRDALATAKERVLRLEALAADRGLSEATRATGVSALRLLLLVPVVVIVFSVIVSYRLLAAGPEDVTPVEVVVPGEPATPPLARTLVWYEPDRSWNPARGPQAGTLPNGKRVYVGMLWRRGDRSNGLHVAMFDHETLAPHWVVGPFDSEWSGRDDSRFHLLVRGQHVLLGDSAGVVRVLDLANGKETGSAKIRRGTEGMCVTQQGPEAVMLGWGAHNEANTAQALFPWELDHVQPFYFDPLTLAVTKAPNAPPKETWCVSEDYCGIAPEAGCRLLASPVRLPKVAASWMASEVWRFGKYRVAVNERDHRALVGWTEGATEAASWEQRVAPVSLEETYTASAISPDSFFHEYTADGHHRIAAFALVDGTPLFNVTLGRLAAARIPLFAWRSDGLFALVEDDMLVLDAKTGALRGKLEAP